MEVNTNDKYIYMCDGDTAKIRFVVMVVKCKNTQAVL